MQGGGQLNQFYDNLKKLFQVVSRNPGIALAITPTEPNFSLSINTQDPATKTRVLQMIIDLGFTNFKQDPNNANVVSVDITPFDIQMMQQDFKRPDYIDEILSSIDKRLGYSSPSPETLSESAVLPPLPSVPPPLPPLPQQAAQSQQPSLPPLPSVPPPLPPLPQQAAPLQQQSLSPLPPVAVHEYMNYARLPDAVIELPSYPEEDPVQAAKEFDEFLTRIESAKNRPMGEKLSKLVDRKDYIQLTNFMLVDRGGSEGLSEEQIQARRAELAKIARLKPGEAYRVEKGENLPRTLTILRNQDGEFQLVVETKSKLAQRDLQGKLQKQSLPKIGGTTKSGKPAWRIDAGEVEMFNLVIKLNASDWTKKQELQAVHREIAISHMAGKESEHINVNTAGTEYKKEGQSKISVYSVKQPMTLHDLIYNSPGVNLSSTQMGILRADLLEAVQVLHAQGKVHQDLKPANILVYRDEDNQFRLKVTDFGLTDSIDKPIFSAVTTAVYQSPEIAYFHSVLSDRNFYHEDVPQSLGNKFVPQGMPYEYGTPHQANDMYAVGIIFFEMQNRRLPRPQDLSSVDDTTKRLLDPNRSSRITVDQAVNEEKQRIQQQKIQAELKQIKEMEDKKKQEAIEIKSFKGNLTELMKAVSGKPIVPTVSIKDQSLLTIALQCSDAASIAQAKALLKVLSEDATVIIKQDGNKLTAEFNRFAAGTVDLMMNPSRKAGYLKDCADRVKQDPQVQATIISQSKNKNPDKRVDALRPTRPTLERKPAQRLIEIGKGTKPVSSIESKSKKLK